MTSQTGTAQRTLVIERLFDAPAKLVFDAWSRPEHLVHWFGPADFTLPTCEQDFRIGGEYKYCMHASSGRDHWVWGVYLEISRYERLAFTWTRTDGQPEPWVDNEVTLSFEEVHGKTKMTMHHALFDTQAERDDHNGGWSECFDRLANYLHQR